MSRVAPDGNARLVFVPAEGIAAPATAGDDYTPTVTELNAVTVIDLTPYCVEWDFPESGNTIDTADISSSFNKTDIGTYGGDGGSITAFRDSVAADDDAWSTMERATRGFWVERMHGGSDEEFAVGDIVSIYPGAVSSRSNMSRTRNNPYQFSVSVAMTDEPQHDIAVVAGA